MVSGWWNIFEWKSGGEVVASLNVWNRRDGQMYLFAYLPSGQVTQTVKNLPIGQWVHLEAQLGKSTGKTGFIRVWQDGTLLWDKRNVKTVQTMNELGWSVNNYGGDIRDANGGTAIITYVDDAVISTTRLGSRPPRR